MINSDIRFVHGGRFSSRGTWTHPTCTLQTWEFIYMIRGCAFLYEGEHRFCANVGDCVLWKPGIEHGGYAESTVPVSFFWLHADTVQDSTLSALPTVITPQKDAQIPLFFRQILHASELQIYPQEMADLLMKVLFTEYAVQAKATEQNSGEIRLVNEIGEWIRINADKPLTVAAVAAQFGYHEDYLTRLFRAHLGIGVKAYIDRLRISHIRTLLLTTDIPLKTIAAEVGFDDYKSFLKYFTYHESVTPTKLRESFYRTHTNNR